MLGLVTHLVISFNATALTKAFFKATTYEDALCQNVAMISRFLPNVRYFGINFWSFQLQPSLSVDTSIIARSKTSIRSAAADERPDFRDPSFLNRTLLDLLNAHTGIELFAFLRNMQPRGRLNWGRENKNNVKKALSRDLKKCMAKVYSD